MINVEFKKAEEKACKAYSRSGDSSQVYFVIEDIDAALRTLKTAQGRGGTALVALSSRGVRITWDRCIAAAYNGHNNVTVIVEE